VLTAQPQPPLERPGGYAVAAAHVGKSFGGSEVLTDIDFGVPRGTIMGFIGPSGCGKTTLVRLMTGVHAPTSGELRTQGTRPDLLSRSQRQHLGYLPQSPVLFENLSVWHNLSFHASLYGVRLRRRRRLQQLLEFVELAPDRRKLARNLSGGMQRRLALAGALVHDPDLIFLDEPTAGIDPLLRRKFWDHFRALRDAGRTLIITTQYVGEAAYCDLVAVLSGGRLVVVDTPEGLRRRAFGGDLVEVVTEEELPSGVLRGLLDLENVVQSVERVEPQVLRVSVLDREQGLAVVERWFAERSIELTACREYTPDYDDVFIRLIERHRAAQEARS
jgi:ABC-2 type transport system ATP-binding protein